MRNGNRRLNLGLIGLFVLVGLGIAVLMALLPAAAVTTGDVYSGSGDWVINNPTKVVDEQIYVSGNLEVRGDLTLWNADIFMTLSVDNQYIVNVTGTGNLMANDSMITSALSWIEFGFTVYGEMTLERVEVSEVWEGVRVYTDDTILIKDSRILQTIGSGLYLKDADGTTVRNLQIQTDDLNVYGSGEAISYDSSDYQQSYSMAADGGALYVQGGNPTIDGVYVSANGTMFATMKLTRTYAYFYMQNLNLLFPLVGINSEEIEEVSNIHVRDSLVNFRVHYNCYAQGSYSGYYFYTYTAGFGTAVNVLNFGDTTVSNCTASNIRIGSMSITSSTYGLSSTVQRYTATSGTTLFGASINKMYSTAGPHYHKFTLANMEFESEGVLAASVTPNYNGTVAPTFYIDIVIENVTCNKGSIAPFSFSLSPQFSMLKTFYYKVHIKNSTFTNMTGQLHTDSLSAGPGVNANVHSFDVYYHVLYDNCLMRYNRPSMGLYYHPSKYKNEFNNIWDTHLHYKDCRIWDSQGYMLYFFGNPYITGGDERITFEGCHIKNHTNTGSYGAYIYYVNRVTFVDNIIEDCVYYYGWYMIDYGGYSNGKKLSKFLFDNNTIRNTYATYSSYSYGLWRIYWGGELIFTNNNVSGSQGNALHLYEYVYYSGYARLEYSGNELFNNNGSLIYHYGYSNYHEDLTCYIENNVLWDNNAFFTDYYDQYVQQYDFDATIYFRNNTIYRSSSKVLREYGKLIVTGNKFRGCGGYVIEIDYLSRNTPIIANNDMLNCNDVYYIGAKDQGAMKMSISLKALTVDCTGNAFYFSNLDVTMEEVEITASTAIAIIADKANVDAMNCDIPIGSGRTHGDGTITVWFEIEAFVEWSNATAPSISSGVQATGHSIITCPACRCM